MTLDGPFTLDEDWTWEETDQWLREQAPVVFEHILDLQPFKLNRSFRTKDPATRRRLPQYCLCLKNRAAGSRSPYKLAATFNDFPAARDIQRLLPSVLQKKNASENVVIFSFRHHAPKWALQSLLPGQPKQDASRFFQADTPPRFDGISAVRATKAAPEGKGKGRASTPSSEEDGEYMEVSESGSDDEDSFATRTKISRPHAHASVSAGEGMSDIEHDLDDVHLTSEVDEDDAVSPPAQASDHDSDVLLLESAPPSPTSTRSPSPAFAPAPVAGIPSTSSFTFDERIDNPW
ncbi:hypothetical protein EUX98_g8600 [Antrodiella citrinella]|uniref:Uncharacterized protein n=1 Tax=Antrodiella citrinella TaxID=2447956 RepID=A0A4S4M7F5_9APHY|nr:hypothetical protein EUX98_g8600 [Antrodiella citrinella]